MAKGGDHRTRMMRGVEKDNELAFRAYIGAAEKSSQREARTFEIRLRPKLQLASAEQFGENRKQLGRFPRLLTHLRPFAHLRLDVRFDDRGELLEQVLIRKIGCFDVVGGEYLF